MKNVWTQQLRHQNVTDVITVHNQWSHFGVFIVNFETYFTPCSSVYVVDFEQVNADKVVLFPITSTIDQ